MRLLLVIRRLSLPVRLFRSLGISGQTYGQFSIALLLGKLSASAVAQCFLILDRRAAQGKDELCRLHNCLPFC